MEYKHSEEVKHVSLPIYLINTNLSMTAVWEEDHKHTCVSIKDTNVEC